MQKYITGEEVENMNKINICEKCLEEYSPEEINGVRTLKEFKGYTIDIRLKQFRKFPKDDLPEFIEFDSKEGLKLLAEMHAQVLN